MLPLLFQVTFNFLINQMQMLASHQKFVFSYRIEGLCVLDFGSVQRDCFGMAVVLTGAAKVV